MPRDAMISREIVDKIVLGVRTGAPMKVAAAAAGVGESTLYMWISAGQGKPSKLDPNPLYAELAEKVAVAKGEAHLLAVGTVRTAIARGNWQAALAWIKMRYPQHYAERMEVTGPGGGPVAMEIASALEGLTEEELASIEAHLLAPGDPEPPRPRGKRTAKPGA